MKIRNTLFVIIALSFIFNFLLIVGHFIFAVSPEITKSIEKSHDKLTLDLRDLEMEIAESGNLYDTIDKFSKETKTTVSIDKLDDFVVNDELRTERLDLHIGKIIKFDGEYYIIKARRDSDVGSIGAIESFIIISSVVIILLAILFLVIAEKAIVKPVHKLQRAIGDYKFGIKPNRTSGIAEANIIQNSFVDLVDSLEEEKSKQNQIIASISHDIKTPLTAILGYSDRVVHAQLTKERRMDYLERIHNKALALKELTEEFDDYLSCNIKSTLKFEDVIVSELLESIEQTYKEDLSEKNIKLIIDSDADEETINIDIAKIKRIFSNTISNSVRHIENFGKITIAAKNLGKYVEFTISDNGPGVPEESLKRLFEPLYTSDPSRKISGLGLAICKDIIENHGGTIFAKNGDDRGLDIVFTIRK